MSSGPPNSLRTALPRLNDRMSAVENIARIEALKDEFAHTITLVELGEGTCGTFAFDLWNDADYALVALKFNVFAGKQFFAWVATRLEPILSPEPGALVMYWCGSEPMHVGLITAGDTLDQARVRSKWGLMPIYDHGLFEVSIDYGDDPQFFRLPDADGIKKLFLEFAESLVGIMTLDLLLHGPMDIMQLTLDEFLAAPPSATAAPSLLDFYSAIATPFAGEVGPLIRTLSNGYALHEVRGQPWDVLLLDNGSIVGAYVGELLAVDDAYQRKGFTVPLVLAAVDRRPLPRSRKLVAGGRAALTKAWRVAHGFAKNPWP